MDFKIKETRLEYNITQKELSDITDIPKRTIENWESGKRAPSPWVETLITSYLKQFPVNERGIITQRKNTYNVDQIKHKILPLILQYDISKLILFGSYAKGNEDPLSDIDIAVDGDFKAFDFFGLVEDINNRLVKTVDVIYMKDVIENTSFIEEINKGIVFYDKTR